ncbi:MAG TPA: resistance to Congo red protein [Pyrinomonadaceae bacterium]
MKLAKSLKSLSGVCFLLMWVPFAMVMLNGPLKLAAGNSQDLPAVESVLSSPWMFAMWTLFAGTFVFFIGSLIVGALSNRRILRSGQPGEATILDIADSGMRINDDPVIYFSLQIRSPHFPSFAARAQQTVSAIHLPSYQPGKILNVKFIPGTDQVAIVGPKM